MKRLNSIWLSVGKSAQLLAGMILAIMFVLTLSEVIGRFFWKPIPGSYEVISFLGALVIGLSATYTSQKNGHINVDFLIIKFSESQRQFVTILTRLMAMAFFVLAGCSLIWLGIDLSVKKEVSQTLRLPFYPVALGIGASFLIQAVQFFLDVLNLLGGSNE
jgi:TRAP-type C4-dicarboxylate transport system permease small subunit